MCGDPPRAGRGHWVLTSSVDAAGPGAGRPDLPVPHGLSRVRSFPRCRVGSGGAVQRCGGPAERSVVVGLGWTPTPRRGGRAWSAEDAGVGGPGSGSPSTRWVAWTRSGETSRRGGRCPFSSLGLRVEAVRLICVQVISVFLGQEVRGDSAYTHQSLALCLGHCSDLSLRFPRWCGEGRKRGSVVVVRRFQHGGRKRCCC